MADKSPDEVERKLFKTLESERIGMLGLMGGEAGHFQPMTAYWEEETRTLWFFTYKDTDLAKAAGQEGKAAMFTFIDKDRHVFACFGGPLHLHYDRERIDRFWNPVVAAWFPDGKDDPRLSLLHLKADSADVWINEQGPVRFGLDILKSNLTKTTPDPGLHQTLRL